MSENWKPIPGWEGSYEVSDLGRVKSLQRSPEGRPGVGLNLREKILRGYLDKAGYRIYALTRNNQKTRVGVHRLVLLAFIGQPEVGMEACHCDGAKENNTLANLRWGTGSSNAFDRVRHGRDSCANRTHCPAGHEYDAANTYTRNRKRKCRTCNSAQSGASRKRRRTRS